MIKRTLIVAVIIITGILCIKFWRYIWPVVAGILGYLFISQGKPYEREKQVQEIKEKEKELNQAATVRQQRTEALIQQDKEHQGKIEAWRERKERWRSRSGGMPGGLLLALCMLLVVAIPTWAGEGPYADLTWDELIERLIQAEKLLDEADQLLALETALKEEYWRLYLEAEADLLVAQKLSQQKDEIIAAQAREIDFLRQRLDRQIRAWGLTGGVTLTGNDTQWSMGVARKKGILSFAGGIGGGNQFRVWAEVTIWLQNPFEYTLGANLNKM